VTEQTPRNEEESGGHDSKPSRNSANQPNENSSANKKLAREAIVKVAGESHEFALQTNLNSVDDQDVPES
jgi:hypothetical protein